MNLIDIIALALTLVVLQLPSLYLVLQRDKRIEQLNKALLRVENPVAARSLTVAVEGEPEHKAPPPQQVWR